MFIIKKGKREKGSWDVSVSLSEKKSLTQAAYVAIRMGEVKALSDKLQAEAIPRRYTKCGDKLLVEKSNTKR